MTRIYPPTVYSYNHLDADGNALPGHGEFGREIPYDCYLDAMARSKVGDTIRQHAGAPGIGYVDYRITRMDETGIYGTVIENTMRMGEPSDFI